MAIRTAAALLQKSRTADAEFGQLSDRDLLTRYVEEGDQAAFAAVVSRHGGMVLGVCKRVLHSHPDAEDACQAVFLVLARKAGSVRWQTSVANWLYTSARNLARNARLSTSRRIKREGAAAVPETVSATDTMSGRELVAALDEELDRLPPRYREPLVLCYLEGLTRDEAAARLGVPQATLKRQLERGRKKLADALTARGYALGVVLLALAATSASGTSPTRLLKSILAATGGSPSETVAALAQGVVVNGLLMRTKVAMLAAVVGVAAMGFGFGTSPAGAEPWKPVPWKPDRPAAKAEAKADAPKPEVKERKMTGKVVGADGKPLVAELLWQAGKPQSLGKTKADGTFAVTVPFKEDGGWLVAKAPGHGMDFRPHGIVYLPQSMTASAEQTLTLPKERPVKGRLLDQQGKPVAGASVVVCSLSTFDSDASAEAHMKQWATELSQRGMPPDGDRHMWFSDVRPAADPDGWSPRAVTDKDGRFEIAGIGAGHLVRLLIRGAGVADKEIVALNRDGFDPNPVNKAAQDYETKGFSLGGKWVLYGPEPTVVLEPEKVIRGTVTDHEGKPRAGVVVAFTRPNKGDLTWEQNQAVTGPDGKYEIRGARKHKGYMVEVQPDTVAGLLPCQGFADDTVGYEPITIDLKCAKGVVVTGTVRDKTTGEPIPAQLLVHVLENNPFVEKYPPFRHSASIVNDRRQMDKAGRFRVVTIPGPVILIAFPLKAERTVEYKPPVPDPKYPDYFERVGVHLMFKGYENERGWVSGCWCKVLDAKATDKELTVDIELEPAPKLPVKVVDADGKPVTDTHATGVTPVEFAHPTAFPTDTLTVFNLEPKAERLLAVFHEKRKVVGTATVKADDKNPVVKLGTGGRVTGRVVGPDGKPLAGLSVQVNFARREATAAFDALTKGDFPASDANGEFRIDTLFPGQEFGLLFRKGKTRFGPDFDKAPKHTIAKHGESLKLGDLKLEPSTTGGGE